MRREVAIVLIALALAGCGGADSSARSEVEAPENERSEGSERAASSERAGATDEASPPEEEATLPPMEVTGTATDTIDLRSEGPALQFLPDRITATSGTRILLRYENGGDLPHNFALFRRDEPIDRMVTAAYEAEATGYVPPSAGDDLLAYSPLLSPGETAEMELVVPPPGRYTYICLFPGHAQMMVGTLVSR